MMDNPERWEDFKKQIRATGETYNISTSSRGLMITTDYINVREAPNGAKTGHTYVQGEYVHPTQKIYVDGAMWYHTDKGWISAKYVEGWVKEANGRWWYVMPGYNCTKNAWQLINGHWYYFDANGWMLESQWISYKDKWYYLTSSGAMATYCYVKSEVLDIYYWLNRDGVWEPEWNTSSPNLKKYKVMK
jgi:glucan-binding YG repeat protein